MNLPPPPIEKFFFSQKIQRSDDKRCGKFFSKPPVLFIIYVINKLVKGGKTCLGKGWFFWVWGGLKKKLAIIS